MKKEFIEVLRKIYDWQKKNTNEWVETLKTQDGLWLEIKYNTFIYGVDYDFRYDEVKIHLTKEQREVLNAVGLYDDRSILKNIDITDILHDHLQELRFEFEELVTQYWDYDDHSKFSIDLDEFDQYDTFEKLLSANGEAESIEVELNDEYVAIIEKGSDNIQVGCQTIHIENIREVLEAWDNLNS